MARPFYRIIASIPALVSAGYGGAAVHPLVRLAAFYASTFLSVGLFVTFVPIHLRALGMTTTMITAIFAGRQLVQSITPPAWGLWADARGDSRVPLIVAALLNTLLFLPVLSTETAPILMACLILQTGASGAYAPLADSMTLTVLKSEAHKFGRVRLPGSFAYGAGVLAFSLFFSTEDLRQAAKTSIPVIAALMALAVLTAWSLPAVPRRKLESMARAGDLLQVPGLWLMFAAGALHWASHSPYNVLFGVHLQDLSLSSVIAGISLCAAVAVEMGVLWFAPRVLHVVEPMNALRVTFIVGAVRWLVSAWTTSPVWIVAAQLLHGITFGFFYVVCIAAVHKSIPEEARSTGQATFMALVFGAGGILGNLVCGWAYDVGKGALMFEVSAAFEVAALLLSIVRVRAS